MIDEFDKMFDDFPPNSKKKKEYLNFDEIKKSAEEHQDDIHVDKEERENKRVEGVEISQKFCAKCLIELSQFEGQKFYFPQVGEQRLTLNICDNTPYNIILRFKEPGWFGATPIELSISFDDLMYAWGNGDHPYHLHGHNNWGSHLWPREKGLYVTEAKCFESLAKILAEYLDPSK